MLIHLPITSKKAQIQAYTSAPRSFAALFFSTPILQALSCLLEE
jgi:hypothetical protein